MDYSRFDWYTLQDMRDIAWENMHDALPEEREFWTAKYYAINAVMPNGGSKSGDQTHEDFDIPRAVSGTGWTPFVPTDPNDATRQLQAGVPEVHTPVRTGWRTLDGQAAKGTAQLKRIWGASDEEPWGSKLE